jgi:hypothetical protein
MDSESEPAAEVLVAERAPLSAVRPPARIHAEVQAVPYLFP